MKIEDYGKTLPPLDPPAAPAATKFYAGNVELPQMPGDMLACDLVLKDGYDAKANQIFGHDKNGNWKWYGVEEC